MLGQNRLIHIADLCLASSSRDGRSTWEALIEALEQSYELGVKDCAKFIKKAKGDSVAQDMLSELRVA